tara:strand:- start:727 stop:1092 length:366 start_codon:yes stop_codon:yes gene_type:complete
MAKQKRKRPTTRELDLKLEKEVKIMVNRIFELQKLVQEIAIPTIQNALLRVDSNSILIEKYIEYKKETEEFVNFLDKESKNEEVKNKSPETREKEQTEGSGTAKTSSKDGERIGIRSLQQR